MLAFFGPGPFELLVILFIFAINIGLTIIPFWFIFQKAGFHGAFSLLMLVPLVNIAVPFFLAFAEWPALKNKNHSHTPPSP